MNNKERKVMNRVAWGVSIALVWVTPGAATVLSVPSSSYPTIQSGIDAAVAGDVVAIAPGTYFELLTIDHSGIAVQSTAGASATIVDAGGRGGALRALNIDPSTRIEGLTFRNGVGLGAGLNFTSASPTLSDCAIEGCNAYAAGGAYLDQGSSPRFNRCIIRNNRAPGGSGGGVYADHQSMPTLSYCLIYGNTCGAYGGGVTAWVGSTVTLDHCTIVANAGALGGGNAYVTRAGSIVAHNSIMAFPTASANVEATPDAGTSTLDCCDLFVSSGSNVVGFPSPVGSAGNFSLDPQFCGASSNDFGLTQTSPCASSVNTTCRLVGALDTQCSTVPTIVSSWGRLRTRYQ